MSKTKTKKSPLTEQQFLDELERAKKKRVPRELFRPQTAIPDRKKEESRRKCRKKPGENGA